jgi:hypothetical protein
VLNITDVELSYNNKASHVSNISELASQVLRFSVTNLARHDDNLNGICHDETNGDRTSDDLYC